MSDYRPGTTYSVVGQLSASITVVLLRQPNGETLPHLTRPDQYTGYVARIEFGETLADDPTVLFTRDSLAAGRQYRLRPDVQVFSERLRLLRTTAQTIE